MIAGAPAMAQSDMSDVEITTVPVADNIYMLIGAGGNIGLCVGDDSVFMIDDQFAPLTDKIMAAVRELSDKPVKVLLNTHWHFDHTGGNEHFGNMGATIIAHDNVYARMSTEQKTPFSVEVTPPSPPAALPVITYAENATIHLCGYTIRAQRVGPAHTDGDTVVHFVEADVYHMGDIFFNGLYPFIDKDSGGDVDGVIEAAKSYAASMSSTTKVIPGHGPLATREDLATYADVIETIRDRVAAAIADGKSATEIEAMQVTQDFDAKWGGGFLSPAAFTALMVRGLSE